MDHTFPPFVTYFHIRIQPSWVYCGSLQHNYIVWIPLYIMGIIALLIMIAINCSQSLLSHIRRFFCWRRCLRLLLRIKRSKASCSLFLFMVCHLSSLGFFTFSTWTGACLYVAVNIVAWSCDMPRHTRFSYPARFLALSVVRSPQRVSRKFARFFASRSMCNRGFRC